MQEKLKACELCGKHAVLAEAVIEGTFLSVCKNCLNFGTAVVVPHKEITKGVPRKIIVDQEIEIVTSKYALLIKDAREKLGLKQEELAQRISERESVMHRLESGMLKPTLDLARKLENSLGIKLIEKYREEKSKVLDLSDSSLTIGDILKTKRKLS